MAGQAGFEPATPDLDGRGYDSEAQPVAAIASPMLLMTHQVTGTLLLVEDDDATRRMFETALTHAGFIVHSAGHGAEALTRLRSGSFDLVVLDLLLPWITGLGVLNTMRQNSATAQLPVIVVTGAVLTKHDLMDLGGVTVLRKPVDPDELVAAVNAALYGGRRQSDTDRS